MTREELEKFMADFLAAYVAPKPKIYVIGAAAWERALARSSAEERDALLRMRDNGSVIVSSMFTDQAYEFDPSRFPSGMFS